LLDFGEIISLTFDMPEPDDPRERYVKTYAKVSSRRAVDWCFASTES